MKTVVMFINQSQPLANTTVRVAGEAKDYITNEEGKIEIDLAVGAHSFEILLGHEKILRTVNRKGESSLFVVDASRTSETAITTLNTLQVDLSQMVGDRYVFETILGRGGMGIVVKAVDRLLNRPVAIKMLSDELRENEEAQQIFLVEARNLATLSHPNLVAIHDILNIDGRVLMIFEYVLGENLEKLVQKRGPMKQMDALRMAIQLTRVVAYLHEHELIHRDLKPSNIILQGDGTLKLVDFGLARSLNELYMRGTRVRGTPAYMAPEQVMGINLTVATDIYQIGITLFEALSGELPFPSGDMAYAHVHVDPPRLAERRPDLDPELQALVNQCLNKQPRDRPLSARELLEKLSVIYSKLANARTPDADSSDSVSVPGFDELNTSSEALSVDTHFATMESGEIDIIDQNATSIPASKVKEKTMVPGVWLAATVIFFLVIGTIYYVKNLKGVTHREMAPIAVEDQPLAKVPGVEINVPEEVAAEVPGVEINVPEEAPEEAAEVPGVEINVREEAPEPAKTVARPAAKQVVAKPVTPVAVKPVTSPNQEDEVPTLKVEPKQTGGLLKVDGPAKGGLLPVE